MSNLHQVKQYSFVASVYCVTVGFLYLWGYWSKLGVNILEYMNLTDIIKLSLIPILTSFGSFAIGAMLGPLIFSHEKLFPPGGGANTPVGHFLSKHKEFIFSGYVFMVSLIWLFGPINKWHVLPLLIAIPLGVNLQGSGIFKDLVPNMEAERVTSLLICMLPFAAYGYGLLNANEIVQGQKYQYVEVSSEQLHTQPHAKKKEDNLIKLRYLGFVNDYVFLMPMEDKSIIVTRFDKLGTLKIKSSAKQ